MKYYHTNIILPRLRSERNNICLDRTTNYLNLCDMPTRIYAYIGYPYSFSFVTIIDMYRRINISLSTPSYEAQMYSVSMLLLNFIILDIRVLYKILRLMNGLHLFEIKNTFAI